MSTRSLPLITQQQLASLKSAGKCIVTLNNRQVFDVTDFIDDHPGGGDIIEEWSQKDITDIMRDVYSHVHSESAYEMMEENYLIAVLVNESEIKQHGLDKDLLDLEGRDIGLTKRKPFELTGISSAAEMEIKTDYESDYKKHKFLDLSKPLLKQVLFGGFSKDFYLDQVHRPRHYGKGSVPLFGNFLEPLSKTPWWVIPTLWLPTNGFLWYLASEGLRLIDLVTCLFVGLLLWTLIEYSMHRFLFHLDNYLPDNSVALTVHFLLHGVHHYLPMDGLRLVMPPTLFVALATPFWRLAQSILPYYWAIGIFAGGTLGYIIYDMTHYFLHHKQLPKFFSDLKENHMEHHYKNYELGFGVTSTLWDHILRTTFPFYETKKGGSS